MDGLDELMGHDKADLIYSDPPWGQGNLRYWKTINKRMTGDISEDVIYEDFLSKFFSICQQYAKDKIVIEYGCQWAKDIIETAEVFDFTWQGTVKVFYGSKSDLKPCDIHFFAKHSLMEIPSQFSQECAGLYDLELVNHIFDFLKVPDGGICLDPMCGMGFTAQASMSHNMSFRGNELNSKRLEKTIGKLRRGQ